MVYIASQIESIDVWGGDAPPSELQIKNFEPTCFIPSYGVKLRRNTQDFYCHFVTSNNYSIYQILEYHKHKKNFYVIFKVRGIIYVCQCKIGYISFHKEEDIFSCDFACFLNPQNIVPTPTEYDLIIRKAIT
jgi:hypothetical protein